MRAQGTPMRSFVWHFGSPVSTASAAAGATPPSVGLVRAIHVRGCATAGCARRQRLGRREGARQWRRASEFALLQSTSVPRATVDVGAPRARKGPGRLCTSAFRREWCAQAPPRGCTALPAWNRGGSRDVGGCCRASTVRVARRVRELQALSRQTQAALRSYIATQWFEAAVAARTAVVQRAALR